MEHGAWQKLLDELNQYIDEHYEGKRLLPTFEGTVRRAPFISDLRPLNYLFSASEDCEATDKDDEDDAFGDILKIFEEESARRISNDKYSANSDINGALEAFEDAETFTETLLRIIKEKDFVEADVYNRVFMDRKLFNKIRNNRTYQPSKRTAILLSVALRLTVTETQEFLEKAGFALTHTSKTDIIIEFFMLRGNYDVIEINAALYEHHLSPLNK